MSVTAIGAAAMMRSIIQRIATGPELSKDISYEEARAGMGVVLDGAADPVQAALFLIALRMKRESDDEVRGVLQAVRDRTHTLTADVDELVDLGDPYDGYARTLPAAPFLPPLLAACGVPCVAHGVERMGPKFGVTHHQVLRAAGLPVELSLERAAARLADARCGWAYVDQRQFCPPLHGLADLRTRIVKRQALTTVEVLVGPMRGRRRTHAMTGFVHKPYPRIYALLARHAGFDSALIVRGVEGGVIPSLRQSGRAFFYRDGGEEKSVDFAPEDFDFDRPLLAPSLPTHLARDTDAQTSTADMQAIAEAAAASGLEALAGKPGATYDNLVAGAALCLWHLERFATLREAARAARAALDSGAAFERLQHAG